MISAVGLSKTYGRIAALTDASIEVGRGECIALAGANGSGRTTLLRILATLTRPTRGTFEVDGVDALTHVREVRPRLAYVGSEPPGASTSALRVAEYLRFVQSARPRMTAADGETAIRTAIERAGLSGNAPLSAASPGMRQRVSLAAALAFRSDVLLLDDPLRSLDSHARTIFLEWLREARDNGTTIIAAVNGDEGVATICHRSAELDGGRIRTIGAPTSTRAAAGHKVHAAVAASLA